MGRVGGTETIVGLATAESRSMRTTIPAFVVKQMGLIEGDHLDWELDKNDGTWSATITKKG